MIRIKNEDFIKYNANTKGQDVGDCFARSLSLAYNIPYKRVREELLSTRTYDRNGKPEHINTDINTRRFIKTHGFKKQLDFNGLEMSVEDFVNANPTGNWILYMWNEREANYHMSTLIDGDIYDTWDVTKDEDYGHMYMRTAYLISGENSMASSIKSFKGIPKEFKEELQDFVKTKENEYDQLAGFSENGIKLSNANDIYISEDYSDSLHVCLRYYAFVIQDGQIEGTVQGNKKKMYYKLEPGKDFNELKKTIFTEVGNEIRKQINQIRLQLNKRFGFNFGWEKQIRKTPAQRQKANAGFTLLNVPVDGTWIDADLYKQLPAKYRPGTLILKRYPKGVACAIFAREEAYIAICEDMEDVIRKVEISLFRKLVTGAFIKDNPDRYPISYIKNAVSTSTPEEVFSKVSGVYVFGNYLGADYEDRSVLDSSYFDKDKIDIVKNSLNPSDYEISDGAQPRFVNLKIKKDCILDLIK